MRFVSCAASASSPRRRSRSQPTSTRSTSARSSARTRIRARRRSCVSPTRSASRSPSSTKDRTGSPGPEGAARRSKTARRVTLRAACRSCPHSFVVGVEGSPRQKEGPDAIHGDGARDRRQRGRRDAEPGAVGGDGQIQRGARAGGRHARRRGIAAEREGRARALLRRRSHGGRRTVRGDEGADRRLLDPADEVAGGVHRVGQALPEPDARLLRHRDPPGLRGRRLRRRADPRAARTGGAGARADRGSVSAGARAGGGAELRRTIDAVWRIESPRLIAALTRMTRDVGLAEDLAQDALVAALESWPQSGVPDNPGAWLLATAKHRAIDAFRRGKLLDRKHVELGHELEARQESPEGELHSALDDHVGDDLLSLMFTACHPVLTTEARVALTLRLLGGLATDEIARAFLVPKATI